MFYVILKTETNLQVESPSSHWTLTVVAPSIDIPITYPLLDVVECMQRPPTLSPGSSPPTTARLGQTWNRKIYKVVFLFYLQSVWKVKKCKALFFKNLFGAPLKSSELKGNSLTRNYAVCNPKMIWIVSYWLIFHILSFKGRKFLLQNK